MNGKKLLGVVLLITGSAAGLTAGRAAAADLWIHIDVHGDRKGEQANINLPLSMVHNLSGMIPDEARKSRHFRVKDRDYDIADLRRAWRELRNGPDATYLKVNDADSKVRIAKRGDYLELRATDRGGKGETVEARVPLPVIAALLSGSGDELNLHAALEELARFGEGELLTVTGDDETVRIWVDHESEGR
ncbi:MAG: hypothetical protein ABIS20_05430 [Thermoanaerobaculia bacterium]